MTCGGDCAGMNGILAYDYHSKLLQSCITHFIYVHDLHVGSKANYFCTGVSKDFLYCTHNTCHHSYQRPLSQVLGSDIVTKYFGLLNKLPT